jgi:DNA-binding NarL/FixJ family response regulator
MKILVADDHKLILEGYRSTFQKYSNLKVDYAYDCDLALEFLFTVNNKYDIVILDELMPSKNEKFVSGSQIGKMIRDKFDGTKIILITSLTEPIKIYNLVQYIQPDGFISKNECTPEKLLIALENIKSDNIYYSNDIKNAIKKIKGKSLYLDNLNRQILLLLSQGVMTKNLSDHLPLSNSAVQKRKNFIKIFFDIEKGDDEQLLIAAKRQGFL